MVKNKYNQADQKIITLMMFTIYFLTRTYSNEIFQPFEISKNSRQYECL